MAKRDNTGPHARKRADVLLVERGLFESRARAQAAIEAGFVTADGKAVTKVSETIDVNAAIEARPAHPYVSRGGVKLAGALAKYPIEIENHICLDVGASTGGFTEVLLSEGASLVFAVDVGRDQLHPSLRGHPQVVSMESTDIRSLEGTLAAAAAGPSGDGCELYFVESHPSGRIVAGGTSDASARVDQATIRGAACRDQKGHRPRCSGASGGVQRYRCLRGDSGMQRYRDFPVPDPRRRRQHRILPRSQAWLGRNLKSATLRT